MQYSESADLGINNQMYCLHNPYILALLSAEFIFDFEIAVVAQAEVEWWRSEGGEGPKTHY